MKPEQGDKGAGRPAPLARLPKEEVQYYEEIGTQLTNLEEEEEATLLADNAFEQAASQLVEATSDGVASRVLERLVPHATTEVLVNTLLAMVSEDNIAAVCTG